MQKYIKTSKESPLKLVSQYRTHLMAIAILWVMLFHANVFRYLDFPFNFIIETGYGGVDIFFFLSGFGLYFSSLKGETKKQFYYKRFLKILPAYFILVFLSWLFSTDSSLLELVLELSTLNFWIFQKSYYWYIPSIVFFYLVFPYYIQLFDKQPLLVTVGSISLSLLLSVMLANWQGVSIYLLMTYRIPIFVLGIYFAYRLHKIKAGRITEWSLYIVSILAIVTLFWLMKYHINLLLLGGYWLPFIFIIPGLLLALARLLSFLTRLKVLDQVLIFIGGISLEIYLTHLFLQHTAWSIPSINPRFLSWFVLSFPLAYLLSLIANSLSRVIAKLVETK